MTSTSSARARTGSQVWIGTIVDYPAGQVQGHVLERMFPGIGRLDAGFPGLGIDGPSIGESVDEGEGNLEAAIRNGGPGTAIGLSEGAMVLDAVQGRSSRMIRPRRLRIH